MEYVRHLAGAVRRDIGTDLELEELAAYGFRGLVEAADRFDPNRGVAFKTFSYYRIRGAIFDGLRQTGWLSRREYARFQAASNDLLQSLSDRPGPDRPDQPAEEAANQLAEALDQLAVVFVTSLDQGTMERTADSRAPDAAQILEARDARARVRQALEKLPERERTLIQLYYFEDQSLETAGKALGLSKSWASRLHARAIQSLGALLDASLGP